MPRSRFEALSISPEMSRGIPWSPHISSSFCHPAAPVQPIRLQITHTFDDILVTAPRHITTPPSDLQGGLQHQVLGVLARPYKRLATLYLSDRNHLKVLGGVCPHIPTHIILVLPVSCTSRGRTPLFWPNQTHGI